MFVGKDCYLPAVLGSGPCQGQSVPVSKASPSSSRLWIYRRLDKCRSANLLFVVKGCYLPAVLGSEPCQWQSVPVSKAPPSSNVLSLGVAYLVSSSIGFNLTGIWRWKPVIVSSEEIHTWSAGFLGLGGYHLSLKQHNVGSVGAVGRWSMEALEQKNLSYKGMELGRHVGRHKSPCKGQGVGGWKRLRV